MGKWLGIEVEFRFEKLNSWQFAIDFCGKVYEFTKTLPNDERFGLISQLRVPFQPTSLKETENPQIKKKIYFIEIAYSSLMEVVSHVEVVKPQDWTTEEDSQRIRSETDRLARIMSGYRKHLFARM